VQGGPNQKREVGQFRVAKSDRRTPLPPGPRKGQPPDGREKNGPGVGQMKVSKVGQIRLSKPRRKQRQERKGKTPPFKPRRTAPPRARWGKPGKRLTGPQHGSDRTSMAHPAERRIIACAEPEGGSERGAGQPQAQSSRERSATRRAFAFLGRSGPWEYAVLELEVVSHFKRECVAE